MFNGLKYKFKFYLMNFFIKEMSLLDSWILILIIMINTIFNIPLAGFFKMIIGYLFTYATDSVCKYIIF